MPADVAILPVEDLARRFAGIVEREAALAIAQRDLFALAIPGGSAAKRLLPSLVSAPVDWGRTEVFWVDERMVPPDHGDSNYRIARTVWLGQVAIPQGQVHRVSGEAGSSAAAADYARLLRERLGEPARLDLVVLGVGEDGHVASLFPGHALLRAWDRDVAALDDAPKPPPHRVTLTLRALAGARRVVVFASGASKAAVIGNALQDADSELPVALATLGDAPVTFLLDPEAASKLPR